MSFLSKVRLKVDFHSLGICKLAIGLLQMRRLAHDSGSARWNSGAFTLILRDSDPMETLSRHALPSRRDPLESADDSRIGGVLKSGIPPCHPFTDWILHTAKQHIEMGSLC